MASAKAAALASAPKEPYRPDSGRPDDLYTRDFLDHMKNQELRLFKRYFRKSPQLDFRPVLVGWMALVIERAKLKRNTLHLAVKLLDFFMDGHNVQQDKLYLVAIAAITIAAKFDENESKVPRLSLLINCTPSELQADFRDSDSVKNHGYLETIILTYFDWNVYIPTCNSFVEVLIPQVIAGTDSFQDKLLHPLLMSHLRPKFMDHLRYFLRSSIVDSSHIEVRPSVMACSVVYAARYCFGLSPLWPPRLTDLVGLEESDFVDCAFVLIDTYQRAVTGRMGVEGGSGVVGQRRWQLPPPAKKGRKKNSSSSSNSCSAPPAVVDLNMQLQKTAATTAKVDDRQGNKCDDDEEVVVVETKTSRKRGGGGPIRNSRRQTAKAAAPPAPAATAKRTRKGGRKSGSETDEGYGSFLSTSTEGGGGGARPARPACAATAANNVEMLIRSSEVLDATERRHQSFKREIKEEILGCCSQDDD